MSDAKSTCWQPCPNGNADCCGGLTCFDTSTQPESGATCTNSDYSGSNHFFCGSSWCDAAYSCTTACPGGSNDECPGDTNYCYADIPCETGGSPPPDIQPVPSIFSKYCGNTFEEAADLCWQPCEDDGDCCAGQTCYSDVDDCVYDKNIGADHFFCGSDFCDAANNCPKPCPSGWDLECDDPGQRCFANVPCNANIEARSADFLRYGLPEKAMLLMREYNLEEYTREQTTNASSVSMSSNSFPFGVFFGLSLIGLIGLNVFWVRNTNT